MSKKITKTQTKERSSPWIRLINFIVFIGFIADVVVNGVNTTGLVSSVFISLYTTAVLWLRANKHDISIKYTAATYQSVAILLLGVFGLSAVSAAAFGY